MKGVRFVPRKSGIRYFKSRKAFYTQIQGTQYPLAYGPDDSPNGPTYKAAWEEFQKLCEELSAEDERGPLTVQVLVSKYLRTVEADMAENTMRLKRQLLSALADGLSEAPASGIDRELLRGVIRQHRCDGTKAKRKGWEDSTVSQFLSAVSAMYNWAIDEKLLRDNPAKGVRKPGVRSRGQEAIVSMEEHNLILAASSAEYGEIARALAHTGARPSELFAAESRHWNDEKGAIVYHRAKVVRAGEHRHKTARSDKTRTIFFFGDELERMRRRVKERPHGKLFRTSHDGEWNINAAGVYTHMLKKRLQLPHFSMYSYRHTYCTKWILAGRSIDKLAVMVGSSAQTLRHHYSHLDAFLTNIRDEAEGFSPLG